MSECIEWSGRRMPSGYGRVGGQRYAHRVAWESAHGPIPQGMSVLHRCDNPSCINIEHLFIGTQRDNMADCVSKGRHKYVAHYGESNGNAKLTSSDVSDFRRRYTEMMDARPGRVRALRGWLSEMSRIYGVTPEMLGLIIRGKNWRA